MRGAGKDVQVARTGAFRGLGIGGVEDGKLTTDPIVHARTVGKPGLLRKGPGRRHGMAVKTLA